MPSSGLISKVLRRSLKRSGRVPSTWRLLAICRCWRRPLAIRHSRSLQHALARARSWASSSRRIRSCAVWRTSRDVRCLFRRHVAAFRSSSSMARWQKPAFRARTFQCGLYCRSTRSLRLNREVSMYGRPSIRTSGPQFNGVLGCCAMVPGSIAVWAL